MTPYSLSLSHPQISLLKPETVPVRPFPTHMRKTHTAKPYNTNTNLLQKDKSLYPPAHNTEEDNSRKDNSPLICTNFRNLLTDKDMGDFDEEVSPTYRIPKSLGQRMIGLPTIAGKTSLALTRILRQKRCY